MKRLLLTLLIAALPLLAQAKKGILRYEYSDGESYYTLEIDTDSGEFVKSGRLCVYYVEREYYIFDTMELTLSIDHIDNDKLWFVPYFFELHGHNRASAEIWSQLTWGPVFENVEVPDGFFVWYDIKNNLQQLERGYHPDYYAMELSPFFHQYRYVEWFPPRMTRVKKFDYDRFPEDAKREIKKRRLK